MALQPCVIVDVNGSLSDTTHRNHFIADRENRDWEGFFGAMMTDTPIDMVHRLVNSFPEHPFYCHVIMVTGGPEKYRPIMEKWFQQNQIHYNKLYMRGNGEFVRGYEFKRRLIEDELKHQYDIVLALDDKMECIEMYRKLGIQAWLVAQCTYEKYLNRGSVDSNPRNNHQYRQSFRRMRGAPRVR